MVNWLSLSNSNKGSRNSSFLTKLNIKNKSPDMLDMNLLNCFPILNYSKLTLMICIAFNSISELFENLLNDFIKISNAIIASERNALKSKEIEIIEEDESKSDFLHDNNKNNNNNNNDITWEEKLNEINGISPSFLNNFNEVLNKKIEIIIDEKYNEESKNKTISNKEDEELNNKLEEIKNSIQHQATNSLFKEPSLSDFTYINSLEEENLKCRNPDNSINEKKEEIKLERLMNDKDLFGNNDSLVANKSEKCEDSIHHQFIKEENKLLKNEAKKLQESLNEITNRILLYRNQIKITHKKHSF